MFKLEPGAVRDVVVLVAGLLAEEDVDSREVVDELPAGRFGAPVVELVRGRFGGTFSVFELAEAVEGFFGFGVLASTSEGIEDASTAGLSGGGASVAGGGASVSAMLNAGGERRYARKSSTKRVLQRATKANAKEQKQTESRSKGAQGLGLGRS